MDRVCNDLLVFDEPVVVAAVCVAGDVVENHKRLKLMLNNSQD